MTRHLRARPSPSATAAVVLAALGAGAASVAVVSACLPELDPLQEVDPVPDSASAPGAARIGQFCGDGLIQLLDDGGDAGESCDPGGGDGGASNSGSIPGCLQCQILCPDGRMNPVTNHCYFVLGPTATYPDAIDACSARGAHVVTLADGDEARFASTYIDDLGGGTFWLGLASSNEAAGYATPLDEPGYPRDAGETCRGCFGANADGGPFRPLEEAGISDECVVSSDGGWFVADCNAVDRGFRTLCEREPPGQRGYYCGGPTCTTVPVTFGHKRYVLDLTPVSADQAVQACASLDAGLVILDSAEEREELMREVQLAASALGPGAPPATVWIGLRYDDGTKKDWVWEDGVAVDGGRRPVPWGRSEPVAQKGRAYLRFSKRYDTELAASDDDPRAVHFRLCERSVE